VLSALNVPAEGAADGVQRLQADVRRLGREVDQLKMKLALGGSARSSGASASGDDSTDVAGVKLIARRVEGLEKGALRTLSDSLRDRLGSGVVVLASENDGKVALLVAVTKDLTARIHAGRLVKDLAPLVGGGGGGRPDLAEAGGKDPSGIPALLARAPEILKTHIQN
jgi:alanyl-tRNA synthetase